MRVSLGEVLEWGGATTLVIAGAHWAGLALALTIAAVSLLYFAQVYADESLDLHLPALRRVRRRSAPETAKLSQPIPSKPAETPVFNCAICGGDTPLGEQHICKQG